MDRRALVTRCWPVLALAIACAGAEKGRGGDAAGVQQAGAAVEIDSADAAKAALGKSVRLRGSARNAKLSAVVVQGALTVYCLDRTQWPAATEGQTVTVQGTLERTSEFDAQVGPAGEISQGTEGGVFVLRRSQVSGPR